jgi:hypothetical protein
MLAATVPLFRLKTSLVNVPEATPPVAAPPNMEAVAVTVVPCAVDPPPDAGVNAIAIAEA